VISCTVANNFYFLFNSAKMESAHSEFLKVIKAASVKFVPDLGVLRVIVSI